MGFRYNDLVDDKQCPTCKKKTLSIEGEKEDMLTFVCETCKQEVVMQILMTPINMWKEGDDYDGDFTPYWTAVSERS